MTIYRILQKGEKLVGRTRREEAERPGSAVGGAENSPEPRGLQVRWKPSVMYVSFNSRAKEGRGLFSCNQPGNVSRWPVDTARGV